MLSHLLVGGMQERFIAAGFDHRRFRIIGNGDFGHSTEKRIGVIMGGDPGNKLLIEEGFSVSFVAGSQDRHKKKSGRHRAVGGVVNRNGLPCPVDEHLLSGAMNLAQDWIERSSPTMIEFAETAVAVTRRVILSIFLPE